jgi:hypothetical protein
MDEMEFDKTRKAIGAEKLQGQDRKAMMEKLASAGGHVLNERSLKDNSQPGSDADSKGGQRSASSGGGDFRMPSEIAREKRRIESEKQAQMRRHMESEIKSITGFTARFIIKLKGSMAGITHFSSDSVTVKFMSQLNLDAKRAVMECSILANDLFMSNPAIGREIVKELDSKGPIYTEVIERSAKLYDRTELAELTSAYSANPDSPVPLTTVRRAVFSLLRKLYYLKPYQEMYLAAVDLAIDIQQKLEKKQSALYASKKKKIRSDWNVLMDVIYPGLVLLAQRAEMKKAEPGTFLFEDMIQVSNLDKLGHRKTGATIGDEPAKVPEVKENEIQDTSSTEEPDADDFSEAGTAAESLISEQEVEMKSAMSRGFEIMQSMTVDQLRDKYDPKNEYARIPEKDKVLIAYLYYKEFDSEYSFILTTPKLQLNTAFSGGEKIDIKKNIFLLL